MQAIIKILRDSNELTNCSQKRIFFNNKRHQQGTMWTGIKRYIQ